jgi:tRNA pseudouridine55 synthase
MSGTEIMTSPTSDNSSSDSSKGSSKDNPGKQKKIIRRKVNGVLILDKPLGITSNAALQIAKRLFEAAKAGHTGSLDPLATGVLPLCFGEATKFSQYLLDADKRYRATFKLGVATNTGDAEGEIVSTAEVPGLELQELDKILDQFRGKIQQVPSMFSALKLNGQPLYKLARQGIEVERKSREVSIFKYEILAFEGDQLKVYIECSKGTYVRTLAEDLGKVLGCGAHVAELRRTQSGPYPEVRSIRLDALEQMKEDGGLEAIDTLLLPVESSIENWPAISLTQLTAAYFKQGQAVQVAQAPAAGWIRIFSEVESKDPVFLGVGEILEDGKIAPRRLVVS